MSPCRKTTSNEEARAEREAPYTGLGKVAENLQEARPRIVFFFRLQEERGICMSARDLFVSFIFSRL